MSGGGGRKSMGSFVGSFLLCYMRISRWGEIRKKNDCVEKAACFLTEAALEEPVVTLPVVNKPGTY